MDTLKHADVFRILSLMTKKQATKFSSANVQKVLSPSYVYHIETSKSVDLDEVAHNEPPHQDLPCLQIQLFFVSDP